VKGKGGQQLYSSRKEKNHACSTALHTEGGTGASLPKKIVQRGGKKDALTLFRGKTLTLRKGARFS